MNSRKQIPQRQPIFVGCEGHSEGAYAALIQDFARERNLHIHLQIKVLAPGAGDPLARVKRAVQEIVKLKKHRTRPAHCFIFLDHDQADRDPIGARSAIEEATRHRIQLIWQRPCFEAMLLRHLPQQGNRRPTDSASAMTALTSLWPNYKKGLPRAALASKLTWQSVIQAAQAEVDLHHFLRTLGFQL